MHLKFVHDVHENPSLLLTKMLDLPFRLGLLIFSANYLSYIRYADVILGCTFDCPNTPTRAYGAISSITYLGHNASRAVVKRIKLQSNSWT